MDVEPPGPDTGAPRGRLHHLELWVADHSRAEASLGWLFARLGYVRGDSWASGSSWHGAGEYLVLESGPDVLAAPHERRRPGMNHLAFHAGSEHDVEALAAEALGHGFTLLFADRHPHAGGPGQYAAYLEDADGFEVELVAGSPR